MQKSARMLHCGSHNQSLSAVRIELTPELPGSITLLPIIWGFVCVYGWLKLKAQG